MFDTMTMTKAVGAVCGSLLVFMLAGWAADGLYTMGGSGHGAEGDDDDLGGEDEVGAHRALDLLALEGDHVHLLISHSLRERGVVRAFFIAVQQRVEDFLGAFEAQEGTAGHQQGRDGP